jgi:hypothetical protein
MADQNSTPALTWQKLVRREPRLAALRDAVLSSDLGDDEFDGDRVWYTQFKRRVSSLVGWDAGTADPVLASREAYDVVYFYLYNECLPADRFVAREEA